MLVCTFILAKILISSQDATRGTWTWRRTIAREGLKWRSELGLNRYCYWRRSISPNGKHLKFYNNRKHICVDTVWKEPTWKYIILTGVTHCFNITVPVIRYGGVAPAKKGVNVRSWHRRPDTRKVARWPYSDSKESNVRFNWSRKINFKERAHEDERKGFIGCRTEDTHTFFRVHNVFKKKRS